MADLNPQRDPDDSHVPLNALFFERLTHHEDVPAGGEDDGPWYVRFAHAWASWCCRQEKDAERH